MEFNMEAKQGMPNIKPFTTSRTFNASREQLWKAWTDRNELMKWFGPKGFTMPVADLDFRPGGKFHYCLRSADGKEMWGKFVYREIVPQTKTVLVSSFSDANGGTLRHPFSSTWPLETLSTFTLDEKDGKTTSTIEWVPVNPTDAELETFNKSHDGMKAGWAGTFDQLEAYLSGKK